MKNVFIHIHYSVLFYTILFLITIFFSIIIILMALTFRGGRLWVAVAETS